MRAGVGNENEGVGNGAPAKYVYGLVGDGEAQEGQVYEMMNFAAQHKLSNFILFVDYNRVQLSDSLESTINLAIANMFRAGGWNVVEADAHDYQSMWNALHEAHLSQEKPTLIVGHSIMGKGAPGMEEDGAAHKATWHGKAPDPELADKILSQLQVTDSDKKALDDFQARLIKWQPAAPDFKESLSPLPVDIGDPVVYDDSAGMDCRTAYGKALLDLAKRNKNVLALTADLRASVMTKFVYEELPNQHIECGIAEQHMVSCSGGLSLDGFIPFCSTFGAFMSSRAKDQARVNDINRTNVKMVATHCGLSVGEDGPTHQSIDDMGSFLGMFNTMVIEPADPNQTDRIIRYVASHYGNFYVRMGRHKFPIIKKEDGTPFYGVDYIYAYGKCDVVRAGEKLTIAASGAMISEAIKARDALLARNHDASVEIVAVTSIKKFDDQAEAQRRLSNSVAVGHNNILFDSIKKTGKVLTVEDHNTLSGLGGQLARALELAGIRVEKIKMMGPEEYQLSGKWNELYEVAGISASHIEKAIEEML